MPSSEERSLFQIAWPAPPLGKGVVDSFPAVPFHQLILRNMPGMYSIYSFPHSRSYKKLRGYFSFVSHWCVRRISSVQSQHRPASQRNWRLGANHQTAKEKTLYCLSVQDGLLPLGLPLFRSLAFSKVAHGSTSVSCLAFCTHVEVECIIYSIAISLIMDILPHILTNF